MKTKESVRTSSIARKINREWVCRQLFIYVWMDIIIAGLIIGCWCYAAETDFFGSFRWDRSVRMFDIGEEFWNITYVVSDAYHTTLKADAGRLFFMLVYGGAGILILQLLSLLKSIFFDARYVRYRLLPLNEMARKAEELSSIAFDESKFQILENAISHVNPEDGKEHLQIGDKELQGLELAVNNLIDRMRESYRQQSRFVSDASHELRTPISVIQGYANMLSRWGKEDETVLAEGIEAIKHESEHMSTLVEQLLFLARSDSGRHKMEQKTICLDALAKEVYEESMMIDEHHLYSYRKKSEEPVMTCGDPTMLKQTMRILADNAMKYTREGDEIVFASGKNAEGEVFFSVQDTGIGMSEKDVSHVFERFYRSDEVRNSSTGGSGLGLSIAKWIVDKHRGHFDVLSREDLGTRITVYLPDSFVETGKDIK